MEYERQLNGITTITNGNMIKLFTYINSYGTKCYTQLYCRIKSLFFICLAGYKCHYKEPYGFVPEVGCPIHD